MNLPLGNKSDETPYLLQEKENLVKDNCLRYGALHFTTNIQNICHLRTVFNGIISKAVREQRLERAELLRLTSGENNKKFCCH